jgi:hypothetical protein
MLKLKPNIIAVAKDGTLRQRGKLGIIYKDST